MTSFRASSLSSTQGLFEKRDDGVAILTLNRPAKLNALTGSLLDALSAAVDRIADDPEIGNLYGDRADKL